MSHVTGDEAVRYLRAHADAILVVDGSPVSRTNLRRNLEYYGFSVLEAASADEVLPHLRQRRPRVGLTLLDVPSLGTEVRPLLAQILRADPQHRVLLCVDQAPSAVRMTEARSGVIGMLRKPVRTERLLRAVSQALGL